MKLFLLVLALSSPIPPRIVVPRIDNEAPTCGLLIEAKESWGVMYVKVGFPSLENDRPKTLLIVPDTVVTDYGPPMRFGPREEWFRLKDPQYVGRYCIACKDEKGNVISFQMSAARN